MIYKDALFWRLVIPPICGEVNALPLSRGWLLATNGILCLIETLDGKLYEGHIQHFESDSELDKDNLDNLKDPSVRPEKPKKLLINLEDYERLLNGDV